MDGLDAVDDGLLDDLRFFVVVVVARAAGAFSAGAWPGRASTSSSVSPLSRTR